MNNSSNIQSTCFWRNVVNMKIAENGHLLKEKFFVINVVSSIHKWGDQAKNHQINNQNFLIYQF